MADYNKIGLLAIHDGRILLCRKKRGTQLLILPGGCLEENETALECLHREIREELGDVSVSKVEFIGRYTDQAATASGSPKTVNIELYSGVITGEPVASSEIAELIWFSPSDDLQMLSPSLRNRILPDLIARGMI
jgi:8-oxo-dGTP pyrophosphatase MutT (NUDIX family)